MARLLVLFCLFLTFFDALAQSYQPGYFITPDRKQVKGAIKFNSIQCGHLTSNGSVPARIEVKPENESKIFEVTADEIRGFVMGLDSFVVMKNIPVSEQGRFKRDFVKVEALGHINLYIHSSQIPSGRFGTKIKKVYILLKKGTKKLIAFHNRYQKEQFKGLISDDPELLSMIENDWRWMDKIPQVIKRYNLRFANFSAVTRRWAVGRYSVGR